MAYQSSQDAINQPQLMDASSSIDVSATATSSNSTGEGEEEQKDDGANSDPSEHTSWKTSDPKSENVMEDNDVVYAGEEATKNSTFTAIAQNSPLQDISSLENTEAHMVNGIYDNEMRVDEMSYQLSSAVDLAGGSDTDTSKADSVEHTKDGNLVHVRSNSIKKPTSFKAVSVTKNYLAKTGAGAMAAAKASGDKGSLSQQTAKPRLVAKFGRDSRSSPVGNGPSSGAPDASKVWNKNRPTPQPPQRQMTDEELKQHYGIHLATRIQADEAGKDSKWADIDDDEDNWAPEIVEWIDGTKSTLISSESQTTPSERLPEPSDKIDQGPDPTRSTATGIPKLSSAGTGKTILRPGSHSLGQTKPGLILRSVPENTAVQPKSSTPGVSKSPWAALPPVDKVPPVFINPPSQPQSQQIIAQRDPQDLDSTLSAPSPAKEIAADDFDRSWRDSDRGHRELFNSQSGRYEPVKDRRRSSLRNEAGFRQPSVLQRPLQSNGPAEPSPAFQTRRRTSSSVSDRNGIFAHSSSIEKLEDMQGKHQPVFGRDSSPSTSQTLSQNQSPVLQQRYAAKPPDGKRPQPGVPDTAIEDPVAVQNRLMRERIELNRKRKQEEEAEEEAARKERIRLKMESLGPAPSPVQDTKTGETIRVDRDGKAPGATLARSPPKPSTTASISEAQSQILQKMAHSPSVDRAKFAAELQQGASPSPVKPLSDPMPSAQTRITPMRSQDLKPLPSPKARSDEDIPRQIQSDVDRMTDVPHDSNFEPKQHSWKATPPNSDTAGGWANNALAPHPPLSRNVWGPPTNDRSLGNGVFERDFHRLPSMQVPVQHPMLQASPAPGPIGPPSPSPRIPYETARIVSTPSPSFDQPQPNVPPIGPQRYSSTTMANNRSNPQIDPSSSVSRASFPGNVDNFYRSTPPDLSAAKSAWQNLPSQIASDEAEEQERLRREQASRLADEQRTGVRREYQPTYRETYRQTNTGEVVGSRKIGFVSESIQGAVVESHEINATVNPHYQQTPQGAQYYGTPNGRSSRFFAPSSDRHNLDGHIPRPGHPTFDEEATPPPDGDDHPAFSSKSHHPLVNLPVIPEIPKVKLPPPTITATPPPESVLASVRSGPPARVGAQPLVNQASWQARFNGLFDKKPAASPQLSRAPEPSKAPALAVTSASKAPLDVSMHQSSATVALPHGSDSSRIAMESLILVDDAIESKPADNVLFDEPEFGSSPTIRLAKSIMADEHYRSLHFPENDLTRYSAPADPVTYYALDLVALDRHKSNTTGFKISVHIPGKQLKSVLMAGQRSQSSQDVKGQHKNPPTSRLRGQSLYESASSAERDSRSHTLPRSSKRPVRTPNGKSPSAESPKGSPRHQGLKALSTQKLKDSPRASSSSTPPAPVPSKDELKPKTPDQSASQQPQKWAKPPQGKNPYVKKPI